MINYFEATVRVRRIDESGHERPLTEVYLIDGVNYTGAETRIHRHMQEITRSPYKVTSIKQSLISEVLTCGQGQSFWRSKITMYTIDEEKGREMNLSSYVLVAADDIQRAIKNTNEGLSYILVPYVVDKVERSTIVEVLPYEL